MFRFKHAYQSNSKLYGHGVQQSSRVSASLRLKFAGSFGRLELRRRVLRRGRGWRFCREPLSFLREGAAGVGRGATERGAKREERCACHTHAEKRC